MAKARVAEAGSALEDVSGPLESTANAADTSGSNNQDMARPTPVAPTTWGPKPP